MKKIVTNILTFLIIFLVVGEILVRLRNSVSDIPRRRIDKDGIQKYYPNQKGFWRGGTHSWNINELGWPGTLPKNYENLISVIGDSYIENFMNPSECHQSVLLKKRLKEYNFIEAGRSGVSFIESLEISKQFHRYNPVSNLIYVKDNDFYQSIVEVAPADDITQFSLETDSIVHGKMKDPVLKKILYNWKFAYFLYNKKYLLENVFGNKKDVNQRNDILKKIEVNKNRVFEFLDSVKLNYDINKMILVFHPNSNKDIIEKCKNIGFDIILLNSDDDDENWSFENDHHWNCYGHERSAEQIAHFLENRGTIK